MSKKPKSSIKTINFNRYHLDFLQKLTDMKFTRNRSEAVRYALDLAIPTVLDFHKELNSWLKSNDVNEAIDKLETLGFKVSRPRSKNKKKTTRKRRNLMKKNYKTKKSIKNERN